MNGAVTPGTAAATTNWLTKLAPAHAPADPGWWPLAPGWWGLGLLIVASIVALIYWQTRSFARQRRIALRELDQIEKTKADDVTLAHQIERLLRRYAIVRYGHDVVAALSGERWVRFVIAHGGRAWSDGIGTNLLRAAYGSAVVSDRTAWLDGARAFLKARQ